MANVRSVLTRLQLSHRWRCAQLPGKGCSDQCLGSLVDGRTTAHLPVHEAGDHLIVKKSNLGLWKHQSKRKQKIAQILQECRDKVPLPDSRDAGKPQSFSTA